MQIQTRRFTIDEYHKMIRANILTEEDRVELLEGEIVEMSPIGSRHAACVNRLIRIFSEGLGQRVIVSVQNPISLSQVSEPEPDVALLKPRADFYAADHPRPEDVLLLVEVADTSAEFDRSVKLPLYARAGIGEVWLVNLAEERVMIYRTPTPQGYRLAEPVERGESVSPSTFPDFSIAVDDVFFLRSL